MKRGTVCMIAIIVLLSVLALPDNGCAEWNDKLQLPSELTPTPTPHTEELAFPGTAEEIANMLNPPLQAGFKGLAGIVEEHTASQPPLKVGALILFDTNSDVIKDDSKPLLWEYGKALHDLLPNTIIIIGGHTDSRGVEEYNLLLSNRRAEAVRTFLIAEFQIEAKRLIAKPFGESEPIASNETEEGQARNRRVEFTRIH